MLIVLAETSTSVKTTTLEIEATNTFTFPIIEMKLSWKARSLSARTSAELFAKARLTVSITFGMSSMDFTFNHHMPTEPCVPQPSSRYS